MGAFDDIAVLPSAEIYLAVELAPTADSEIVPIRVTSAPLLFTEASDDPANAIFRSLVMQSWQLERRLSPRGTFARSSGFNTGNLILSNDRGTLDGWQSWCWNRATAHLRLGGRIKATGEFFPFTEFQTAFKGEVSHATAGTQKTVEIVLAGRKQVFTEPAIVTTYRAFGGAVDLTSSARATTTPTVELNGDFPQCWEVFGRLKTLPSADGVLFDRNNGDLGLELKTTGELAVMAGGQSANTGFSFSPGVFYVGVIYNTQTSATVYAGTTGLDVDQVWTGALPTSAINSGVFELNRGGSCDFEIWELRQGTALDLDRVLDRVDGPISPSVDGLLELVRFEEGIDAQAVGVNGYMNFTLTGSTWTHSLTGDNPYTHGGAILGQSEQDVVGKCFNVPLVAVSTPGQHFVWGRAATAGSDVSRVRVSGGPLIPKEVLVSTGSELAITNDVIQITAPLSGHRFLSGQEQPARDGQRIEIANHGEPHDGIYLIAVDGVAADGLSIKITNEDGSAAGLPDVTFVSGTEVKTPDDDWQYEYDISRCLITTRDFVPDGSATADVVGRLPAAGTYRFSDVLAMLLDETLGATLDITELTFDPLVSYVIKKGSAPSLDTLIETLSRSAWAWWIEKRDGSFKTGTWQLPIQTETPAAAITTSLRYLVEATEAPLTGRVVEVEDIPVADPVWRVDVVYGRNWNQHSQDSLVGSLSPAMRERLTTEWLHAVPWTRPRSRSDYRAQPPQDPFETFLIDPDEAESLKQLMGPFIGQQRRHFDVTVAGLPFLSLETHDQVFFEHPDPTYGLTDGRLCRIAAINEDSAGDVTRLELFY